MSRNGLDDGLQSEVHVLRFVLFRALIFWHIHIFKLNEDVMDLAGVYFSILTYVFHYLVHHSWMNMREFLALGYGGAFSHRQRPMWWRYAPDAVLSFVAQQHIVLIHEKILALWHFWLHRIEICRIAAKLGLF